jgi:phosphoribosyl 1,2-cyclic phosphate phosphodiesterase
VRVDAVLVTHAHADHIYGIDDVRVFPDILLFLSPTWARDLCHRFTYIFGGPVLQEGGGTPHIRLCPVESVFTVSSIRITPVRLIHGDIEVFGYRSGNFAYLTDASRIPDESYPLLVGVELLVINALGNTQHTGHFTFHTAIYEIEKIGPKKAWLTHIGHQCSHVEIEEIIRQEVTARPALAGIEIHPGFDGLVIEGIRLEEVPTLGE